jgi:hypothetical protein
MPDRNADDLVTRQERREERLDKRKEKMPQHGKSLARVYKEVVEKRVDELRENKEKRNLLDVKET